MIMNLDSPSNASLILQKINEENKINLYPEIQKTKSESILESYRDAYAIREEAENRAKEFKQFKNDLKEYIFESYLYTSLIEPILQEQMVSTRQYDLAAKLTENFVKEQGINNLLDRFKYKNVYLAEVAYNTNKLYDALNEGINCRIKEGLSEKDATDIEEKAINNYILDTSSKIPNNISSIIIKRVEGSINDFIDDKKKAQFQLNKIYDKAQQKVDKYNQAKMAVDSMNQLDANPDSFMDNETAYGANMGMQQAQNDMQQTPQQEAYARAKSAEYDVLNSSDYSVFDGMMRSFVESVHKNKTLTESYSNTDNSIDLRKVMADMKTAYTFLECVNTLEMADVDEKYIRNVLNDLAGK